SSCPGFFGVGWASGETPGPAGRIRVAPGGKDEPMSFLMAAPEVTSLLMISGPGSAPMLAAAAAWEALAGELGSAAESFSSVTSNLVGEAWQGPAAAAMTSAAVPYKGWLSAAAAQASGAAAGAQAVASAFESALAATVHPAVVAANRSDLVQLVMSNVFGQNA